MPDYLSPALNAMQGIGQLGQQNANIEDTIAKTLATKQLTENRKQLMQQDQATQQALLLTLKGGASSSDPGTTASDTDSMVTIAQKNAKQLAAQADMSDKLAMSVAQAGGSPDSVYTLRTQAQRDRAAATAAQREVRQEQQEQVKRVGNIANTVSDNDSFQTALAQMQREDPNMIKGLQFDKDLNGIPIYGPKSQRTMDTLAQSSMTVNQQMQRQQKAQDMMDREQKQREDREEKRRKDKLDDANVALRQSQKAATDALTDERRAKLTRDQAKVASAEKIAMKDPTKMMKEDAMASIKAVHGGKFDSTVDAYAGDVAARANKIRYEALKSGDSMSLDDARQQAIDELSRYVKPVTVGGFDIPLYGHAGGEQRWTYLRGNKGEEGKPEDKVADKAAGKEERPPDPNAGAKPPAPGAVRSFQDGKWGWILPN